MVSFPWKWMTMRAPNILSILLTGWRYEWRCSPWCWGGVRFLLGGYRNRPIHPEFSSRDRCLKRDEILLFREDFYQLDRIPRHFSARPLYRELMLPDLCGRVLLHRFHVV